MKEETFTQLVEFLFVDAWMCGILHEFDSDTNLVGAIKSLWLRPSAFIFMIFLNEF